MKAVRTLEERFWPKVDVRGADECWLWRANVTAGYGQIRRSSTVSIQAHRASYEIAHGPIPDGLCVLHSCDNPLCVNPGHLSLGTLADNNADCRKKGRHNCGRAAGEQHSRAKLTLEDVTEIRSSSALHREIALKFNISKSHVSNIRSGKLWNKSQ